MDRSMTRAQRHATVESLIEVMLRDANADRVWSVLKHYMTAEETLGRAVAGRLAAEAYNRYIGAPSKTVPLNAKPG
jgi:hypothetical protein